MIGFRSNSHLRGAVGVGTEAHTEAFGLARLGTRG